ncbi:hypothetical protein CGMCC3_g17608 [Colletotrichum fructicola]|nr:uncharacterized protein CGMCC3_g17608 [Colletotrichum fructicola]KAE9566227.1 hypothetical protein CGMCC3_g17608 [Colletotrichum fructicola]
MQRPFVKHTVHSAACFCKVSPVIAVVTSTSDHQNFALYANFELAVLPTSAKNVSWRSLISSRICFVFRSHFVRLATT